MKRVTILCLCLLCLLLPLGTQAQIISGGGGGGGGGSNPIVPHTISGATPTIAVNSSSNPAIDVNELALTANVTSITLPASSAVANEDDIWLKVKQGGGAYTLPAGDANTPVTHGTGTTVVNLVPGGACPTQIGTSANNEYLLHLHYVTALTEYEVLGCGTNPAQIAAMLNPMTTLGDVVYGGVSGAPTRLAGNTGNIPQELNSIGSAGVATAPQFTTLPIFDVEVNDTSTGTTAHTLAKGVAGKWLTAATTDLTVPLDCVNYNAGTSGSVGLIVTGGCTLVFDGAITQDHAFGESATTGGDAHDLGTLATACASTTVKVLGTITAATNASPGSTPQTVKMNMAACNQSSGGGGVTSVGQTVPGQLQVSGSPVTSSGTLAVTNTLPTTVSAAANCATTTVVLGGRYVYTGTSGQCTFTLPAIGASATNTPVCFHNEATYTGGNGNATLEVAAQNLNTIDAGSANGKIGVPSGQTACLKDTTTTDWTFSQFPNQFVDTFGFFLNNHGSGVSNSPDGGSQSITSISQSGSNMTVNVASGVFYGPIGTNSGGGANCGMQVYITGAPAGDNGTFCVATGGTNTFVVTNALGVNCASSCGTEAPIDVSLNTTGTPTAFISGQLPVDTIIGSGAWNIDMKTDGYVDIANSQASAVDCWIMESMFGNTSTNPRCIQHVTIPATTPDDLVPIRCGAFQGGGAGLFTSAKSYVTFYGQCSAAGAIVKYSPTWFPPYNPTGSQGDLASLLYMDIAGTY